jgi:hypothetical protein
VPAREPEADRDLARNTENRSTIRVRRIAATLLGSRAQRAGLVPAHWPATQMATPGQGGGEHRSERTKVRERGAQPTTAGMVRQVRCRGGV